MRVLLDSTVSIADARGPELDQGSALRLLAEMVWYPTALFDARYVAWSAIDSAHAVATLRFGQCQVSGTFEFGADGLPVGMNAERFMDKQGLRPWGGTYHDWREVSGMLVPFEATVTWQLESGPFTYAPLAGRNDGLRRDKALMAGVNWPGRSALFEARDSASPWLWTIRHDAPGRPEQGYRGPESEI